MRTSPWIGMIAAAALAGCGRVGDEDVAPGSPGGSTSPGGRRPDLRVVLLGNEGGRLKPCGCTSPQTGGIERAAVALERLRSDGVRTISIHAGGALGRSAPGGPELGRAFERAWSSMRIDALATEEAPDASGSGEALAEEGESGDPAVVDGMDAGPWRTSAEPVTGLRCRTAGGDLLVLAPLLRARSDEVFVRGSPSTGEGVADSAVTWTVVAGAGARASASTPGAGERALLTLVFPGSLQDGAPGARDSRLVLPSGGTALVVLDCRWSRGVCDIEARLIPLGQEFDDLRTEGETSAALRVREVLGTFGRELEAHRALDRVPILDPGVRRGFVGSKACSACHSSIVEQWSGTPHAVAGETLRRSGRAWDPACVGCHAVGWTRLLDGAWMRHADGYANPVATPDLEGVGCESCHGPGGGHLSDPAVPYRMAGETGGGILSHCARCHDSENSPGFRAHGEADYLPRVDHRDARAPE